MGLKKPRVVAGLFLLMALFTACEETRLPVNNDFAQSTSTVDKKTILPETVDLVFQPIQLQPLAEGNPDKDWEWIKEIPFGQVEQQKIALNVYKEPKKPDDPIAYSHAFIRYQDKLLTINDFVSPQLSEIPEGDHTTLFLFQHPITLQDNQLLLLGGLELFGNGPGRVAYIVYDSTNSKWFMFEDWGKPRFTDLDSDGVDEFIIQFEGLHLQFPDVTIYSWSKGTVEVSKSIKAAVLGSVEWSFAILGEDNKISIGENKDENPEEKYSYDKGKLFKQSGRK